ncbi:MAG TPA: Fur family transcriptional regulator [Microthrixaceae bacterium]|nr:Fur family transcriptional regulator [Microthrixaceae bacterium]
MVDSDASRILDRLREQGGRVTGPRRVVIEAMLASRSHHLTAGDVVDAVRRRDPDFYESTVYRTLDRLIELGVVDRIQIGPGPAVFHLSSTAHPHLVCDRCGAVVEATPHLLDDVGAAVEREHGFALNPATSPLHGLCRDCNR